MNKDILIEETVNTLSKLPTEEITAISKYAAFILSKYEEEQLQKGIEALIENSASFDFLREDEVIYTLKDLKEKY